METMHLAAGLEEGHRGRPFHAVGQRRVGFAVNVEADSAAEPGLRREKLVELRTQLPAGLAAGLPEIDEEEPRLLLDDCLKVVGVNGLR